MAVRPSVDAGFKSGLKYWLFFMLALAALGYEAILSISLGALGGLAVGVIVAWSQAKEDGLPDRPGEGIPKWLQIPTTPAVPESDQRERFRRYRRGMFGMERQSAAKRRFGWLFRK
jgi:hypothetical protein